MAHLGTLRTFRFNEDVDDIRGADIYGRNDEKLGTIDDIIFDHQSGQIQYAVVDAGGWMSSKKFLVPAERIHERSGHDNDFAVGLTKDQVHNFPEYNERTVDNQDEFRNYETRYREKWDERPVLHKEDGVNIITPEPDEMPAASGSTGGLDVTPTRLADKFPVAEANPSKLHMHPSGTSAESENSRLPGSTRGMGDIGSRQPAAQNSNVGSNIPEHRNPHLNAEVTGRPAASDLNPGDVGYGDIDRTAVPAGTTRDLPPSYRDTVDGQLDAANDLHRPYPVQEGRARRWAAFEDHLRRNRVDVTSSCRACEISDKDNAA